jgi:branched-chain amino acid transport system ATP-binding protein
MQNDQMFFDIQDLRKHFGGVKAVDGVTLTVTKGGICSVIGPNGSGKTTLFNLITGFIRPDHGKVTFLGEDITGKSPKVVIRRGIARSFQIVSIYPRLTVYENIMVAVLAHQRRTMNVTASAKSLVVEEGHRLLKAIGLDEEALTVAGELSHGSQKRLEVGLALAMEPRLLLLDEPTAGMASEEKAGILNTIKDMTSQQDCTVLLSEHDMSVVFAVSSSIWVMHNGQVVAHGDVDEIRNNEIVRKIYLGEAE